MKMRFLILFVCALCFFSSCINPSGKSSNDADMQSKTQSMETAKDSLFVVDGILRIGHEVRCFVADGDTLTHWVVDKTGELYRMYDKATGGIPKNDTPVYAKLRVKNMGKMDIGFSDRCHDTYYVMEILEIRSLK